MPESNLEAEVAAKRDLRHLEDSLQRLWEKAHTVSETLIRLKEEHRELLNRVASLESSEGQLSTSLLERDKELISLRAQLGEVQSSGGGLFDAKEREEMKGRLKELITMINSRL